MDTLTQLGIARVTTLAIVASILMLFSEPASRHAQAQSADLLITEFFYDTPGVDAEEEWVEIANIGTSALHLDGFGLGDEEQAGGGEGMLRFPPETVLRPGQVMIIAQASTGFSALYGFVPDLEIHDSDASVPDMLTDLGWARGDLALNNDGDELMLLDSNNRLLDAVSYGDSATFLSPSVPDVLPGQSLERFPAHCDTNTAGDWQLRDTPSPGVIDTDGECPELREGDKSPEALPIGAIQGAGDRSPYLNEAVTFEGIVTGMLEDRNARGAIFYTLFVQDQAGQEDGDPSTSDGIAVFHGARRPLYLAGDLVRVRGQVTEFFGLTEIDDNGLQVELLATDLALPQSVSLRVANIEAPVAYERLESMLVSLPESIVVGPTFSACGFAVTAGANFRRTVRRQLSDEPQAIVPILHHSDVNCGNFPQVKVGDRVSGLHGPLTYHFDQYKIVNQNAGQLRVAPAPMPEQPSPIVTKANQVTVATFNVHDFFDSEKDTGRQEEPILLPEEVQLKMSKLARTISEALNCPTLLALQEVESRGLLDDLAQQLASACQFRYAFVHHESPDVRGIDLAFLYQPWRIQVLGSASPQYCSDVSTDVFDSSIACSPDQDPLFSRPPLKVDFLLDGSPYSSIVIHFKSKREGERETQARRLAQAGVVAGMVRRHRQQGGAERLIVLGDFNDYEKSATMAALTTGETGLVNVTGWVPLHDRYTYNFGGVSQLLDAILMTPDLAADVAFSTIVHINADFPASWAADPDTLFRSSDHDIPIVVLDGPQSSGPPLESLPTPDNTLDEAPGTMSGGRQPSQPEGMDPLADRTVLLLGIVTATLLMSLIIGATRYWRR